MTIKKPLKLNKNSEHAELIEFLCEHLIIQHVTIQEL
jgi:hypothetical protein